MVWGISMMRRYVGALEWVNPGGVRRENLLLGR